MVFSTYLMSLKPIPISVEKRITKLRRDILLEGNPEKKKMHLVSWKKVMTCKRGGGLSVMNLKLQKKKKKGAYFVSGYRH